MAISGIFWSCGLDWTLHIIYHWFHVNLLIREHLQILAYEFNVSFVEIHRRTNQQRVFGRMVEYPLLSKCIGLNTAAWNLSNTIWEKPHVWDKCLSMGQDQRSYHAEVYTKLAFDFCVCLFIKDTRIGWYPCTRTSEQAERSLISFDSLSNT